MSMPAASIKALTTQLVDSVSSLGKALESGNEEKIQDILTTLQEIPSPPVELLKTAPIVQTLQSVSKKYGSTGGVDEKLKSTAKAIIAKWKEDAKKSAGIDDDKEKKRKLDGSRKSTRPTKEVKSYNEEIIHDTQELKSVMKKKGTASKITTYEERQPIPKRNTNGELVFPDYPEFRPNMTPREVIQAGSFGGTYYRAIYSSVTQIQYDDKQWEEFPKDWFEGLNIKKMVTNQNYNNAVNKYKVPCGGDLNMWESSGWITDIDPYGWYQWYCRFYLGRRCSDDDRQISRGQGVIGKKGRWRSNLMNKILQNAKKPEDAIEDYKISPKVRQLLQHWGYTVTLRDVLAYQKTKK